MEGYSKTDQKVTDNSLDNYIKGNDTNMKFMDCRKKKLFEHDPRSADCRQVAIGDCWLQSILIDILNKKGPEPIKKMLRDSGDNVKVRLYKPQKEENGKRDFALGRYMPRIYTVPKKIPVNNKNISIYNIGARWVHYVQAAVAKSGIRDKYYGKNYTKKDEAGNKYRDYSSIEGGNADLGWHMILGGRIINMHEENEIGRLNSVDEKEDAIYNKVKKALSDDPKDKKLIYMSFNNFPKKDATGQSGGEAVRKGLVAGHAYSICGYEEEGGIKYIRLINPWYNRMGRDYGENGKDRGAEKLFAGIGNESFRLKVSTAAKYLKSFSIEA